jgi:hypothetical protein
MCDNNASLQAHIPFLKIIFFFQNVHFVFQIHVLFYIVIITIFYFKDSNLRKGFTSSKAHG